MESDEAARPFEKRPAPDAGASKRTFCRNASVISPAAKKCNDDGLLSADGGPIMHAKRVSKLLESLGLHPGEESQS